jgi:hypothetical protein
MRHAYAEETRRQRSGLGPAGEFYYVELFVKQALEALEPWNWL